MALSKIDCEAMRPVNWKVWRPLIYITRLAWPMAILTCDMYVCLELKII